MWSYKTEWVKRTILKNSKNLSDLGNARHNYTALKINWVNIMQNANHLEIFVYGTTCTWIKTNQDIWKCNINQNDIKILFKTTPNAFVKDIIQAWAKYSYYNPIKSQDIRNQLIWFNSHIQIDNKPAYFKYMYTSGIKYVHQLLYTQGNILKYAYFKNKYNIDINYLHYYSIINAIPVY